MGLMVEMAEAIREHQKAFADLNNNDDPSRRDILIAVMQQTYRRLNCALARYDAGER